MSYNPQQGAFTQDNQNATLTNPFDTAHTLSVNGAIDPHTPGRYQITKATACALTLGAPVAGLEDGLTITVYSTTAAAHTITATGLFADGAGHVNVGTAAAQIGCQWVLVAIGGKWIADGNGVTYS